ncbi:MAG: sodium:proton antiporter [Cyanobacteria bacterium J069]|nr:MAG: sodium:proton antiporter [Cyanobacteria bacterium J069]
MESLVEPISIEENLKQFLLVISAALIIAVLPQSIPWMRKLPYTVLLVIAGMVLALLNIHFFSPSPELILWIFLPPLLFEAAWNIRWGELRRNLVPVSLYATLGVVVTILGIAFALAQWADFLWPVALLTGACLSATDPVAVSTLLRELGAPSRLKVLVEGESMFNDGTAVVAFSLLLGLATGTETFDLQNLIVEFASVVGIGVGVGLLLGFGISLITKQFDLPLVEQSLTLVGAYAAYLLGETLGGSGVIGTVTVGLIMGNFGSRVGMNPRTRVVVSEFWEFIAFFFNSILFFLIGDQLLIDSVWSGLAGIAVAIAAMLAARIAGVVVLSALSNRITEVDIGRNMQVMLWWSGLRGGVALALALSVPETVPQRDALIAVVFGTVFFTILVQGITVKPLLQALNLIQENPLKQQYLELISRETALQKVLDYMKQPGASAGIDPAAFQTEQITIENQLSNLQAQSQALCQQDPALAELGVETLRKELLAVESNAYYELVQLGRLSQEPPTLLEAIINAEENPHHPEPPAQRENPVIAAAKESS